MSMQLFFNCKTIKGGVVSFTSLIVNLQMIYYAYYFRFTL